MDRALTSPAFRYLLSTKGSGDPTQTGGTHVAVRQRALLRKGFLAGPPRGWVRLVPWYVTGNRGLDRDVRRQRLRDVPT